MAEYKPRLIAEYHEKIVPTLMKRFGYKNIMQVPKLEKIVVNMGVGAAIQDAKLLDRSIEDLSIITGQRPIAIKAR
ncbi:MAG TPA: 50S ribosomal protein L5, partial [bacterium]